MSATICLQNAVKASAAVWDTFCTVTASDGKGNRVDLFFDTPSEAAAFLRDALHTVTVAEAKPLARKVA